MNKMTRRAFGAAGLTVLLRRIGELCPAAADVPPSRPDREGRRLGADGQGPRRRGAEDQDGRQRARRGHDQGDARRPQAQHLYRRHRYAAGRRQPEGGRDPHLPGQSARRRRRPPAVGSDAQQHHDQCGDRDHRRQRRRPGAHGQVQAGRQDGREEDHRDPADRRSCAMSPATRTSSSRASTSSSAPRPRPPTAATRRRRSISAATASSRRCNAAVTGRSFNLDRLAHPPKAGAHINQGGMT